MLNTNKKCLIVDSSGIRPFVFANNNLGLDCDILEKFANSAVFDLYLGNTTISEFSFDWNVQASLFDIPLTTSLLSGIPNKSNAISLSDAGYFSLTNESKEQFSIQISKVKTLHQSKLWEASPNWELLSSQDRDIITLAIGMSKNYDQVAILTNDWNLREQCANFEKVSTYGSASMLAGLVLNNFITHQKGTNVYEHWLNNDPRWIPNRKDIHNSKVKLKFGEVLKIEKERMNRGASFWTPHKYN